MNEHLFCEFFLSKNKIRKKQNSKIKSHLKCAKQVVIQPRGCKKALTFILTVEGNFIDSHIPSIEYH